MRVKGWLIVGSRLTAQNLPSENYCGDYAHTGLPDAASFKVGQWIEWRIDTILSVILVCVKIPL